MLKRTHFSLGELRLLCDCVATVCFNIAGGRGNRRFLPAADAVLADFGCAARSRLTETGPDLAQVVLAEFSSSSLRNEVLTRVGMSLEVDGSNRVPTGTGHRADAMGSALDLVDKRCPEQAFSFRAALILIAMAIEERLASGPATTELDPG
ncbi:MAG: hypothetical protein R3D62_10920 [Xanthobacteraceae bacterium]